MIYFNTVHFYCIITNLIFTSLIPEKYILACKCRKKYYLACLTITVKVNRKYLSTNFLELLGLFPVLGLPDLGREVFDDLGLIACSAPSAV